MLHPRKQRSRRKTRRAKPRRPKLARPKIIRPKPKRSKIKRPKIKRPKIKRPKLKRWPKKLNDRCNPLERRETTTQRPKKKQPMNKSLDPIVVMKAAIIEKPFKEIMNILE